MLARMSYTAFEPASMAFEQGGHPLERKKLCTERPLVVLRFEPGFSDPNWCERAHVIYVLSGALELELEGEVRRVTAGNGCWLDRGTRHRARNPGPEPVEAFLVSDVEVAP